MQRVRPYILHVKCKTLCILHIKYDSRHWRLSIKGKLSHLNANITVGGGIKYDF